MAVPILDSLIRTPASVFYLWSFYHHYWFYLSSLGLDCLYDAIVVNWEIAALYSLVEIFFYDGLYAAIHKAVSADPAISSIALAC